MALAAVAGALLGGIRITGSSLNTAIAKQKAFVDERESARDANTLRTITLGGSVFIPPWGNVNFSDGKPERALLKIYAQDALTRVQSGGSAANGSPAPPPSAPPANTSGSEPSGVVAALQRGAAAVIGELSQQGATELAAEAARNNARETALTTRPPVSSWMVGAAVVGLLVLLVVAFKRS